jgi:molecular chaperone IbpA
MTNKELGQLERFLFGSETQGYPPFNIVSYEENNVYFLEMAVAGFSREDLELTLENRKLTIVGKIQSKETDQSKYVVRKLARREFKQIFDVGIYAEHVGTTLENGILTVRFKKVIPEELKPKKLEIS